VSHQYRRLNIKSNWVDKAIEFVAPVRAAKRFQARAGLAMATSYVGASKSRRQTSEWITSTGDADTDLLGDLDLLRERSRDLIRNTPIATGAINTKVTNIVGSGLKLQSRIDNELLGITEDQAAEWESTTEKEFRMWADSQECDIERTLNFYESQDLAFRSTLESGDVFIVLPMVGRLGSPYKTKIQIIEADRISNPDNEADSETLAGGIERDQNGAPIKYHIMDGHPGDLLSTRNFTWTPVQAFGSKTGRRNVLHLYRKIRPGQTRGVPDLAPVIELIKQLGRYTDSEVSAAVISSFFTVFVKSEYTGSTGSLAPMQPTTETGGKTSDKDFRMSEGAILDLSPGEDIITANPGRPNDSFDPFILAISRQMGAALELPFEILVKHFTASYSAARAAMLEAWRYYIGRRNWLASKFCQPIYETWLTEAVAIGRISAPGFLSGDPLIKQAYLGSEWIGPPRGQIDPVKENKADELAEKMGWKTGATNTAERGGDWETNQKQLAKEKKARMDSGLEQEPMQPGSENDDDTDQDKEDKAENENT